MEFENLTFGDAREAIRTLLVKTLGKEKIFGTEENSKDSYAVTAHYGNVSSEWRIQKVVSSNTIFIQVELDIKWKEDKNKKDTLGSEKVFKTLGLRVTSNIDIEGEYVVYNSSKLSKYKDDTYKIGKFRDFLKL